VKWKNFRALHFVGSHAGKVRPGDPSGEHDGEMVAKKWKDYITPSV
jgi:hypothetical protein